MTTATAKKITLATLKSFVAKNRSVLQIKMKSAFNGMTDCSEQIENDGFTPVVATDADRVMSNNLGLCGVWLVNGSRNSFSHFENETHVGIEVYNCCRTFILAVAK